MELHESLAQLARDHGQSLFTDADAFRGALDDYLDEGAASTGTINLLTDAVRLGALQGMLSMLDSGAGVDDAVDTAGQRLARDRGSADVAGSQWACAVLGYALGRVPVELATRLRPDAITAGPEGPSPTAQRPTPPPGPPPTAQRPGQSPASPVHQPPAQSPAPAGGWQQPPPPGPQQAWSGGPGWQQPQQQKSRKGLFIAIAAAAVVLIVLGVVGLVAALGGDDEQAGGSDDPTSESTSASETTTDATTTAPTDSSGQTLRGTGYSYTFPSEQWQDLTSSTPDSTGTIDSIAAPGDSINTARGNILVEMSSSFGQSDVEELKGQWKSIIESSTGATASEIPGVTIGGEPSTGLELEWTNPNDFEVRQVAYLVVHGDNQYSITASFRQGDDEFEQTFHDVLDTWVWE